MASIGSRYTREQKREMGKRLRELTESYTLDEISRALGVGKEAVRTYERGVSFPSTRAALAYQAFLGLPLEEIFGDELAQDYREIAKSKGYSYAQKRKQNIPLKVARMRKDRKQADLTLEEMAEKINELFPELNLTPQALSPIETGVNLLRDEVAASYAHVLDTSPKQYFPEKIQEKFPACLAQPEAQEDKNLLRLEQREQIDNALAHLSKKQRYVFEQRVTYDRTLEEIGSQLNLSRERVGQIEAEALRKIKEGPKTKSQRTRKPIEDGEILLVHLAEKAVEAERFMNICTGLKEFPYFVSLDGKERRLDDKERREAASKRLIYEWGIVKKYAETARDLINPLFHPGEKGRTKSTIEGIRNQKLYKEKLQKLREKYFPAIEATTET